MVEQFPNDYAQRLNFGELLLAAGQVDEAIRQFQVAQRGTSLKQRSCVMLGRSFSKKQLHDLALEQFDRAIADTHGMDEFKKDVLYSSAQCCEALGKQDEAIRRYKLIYANDISFRDVASKIDGYYSDPS
jgi:tetratricopeptide (TPR) repeat protein